MSQTSPSFMARLFAGAELQQSAQALARLESERARIETERATLERERTDVSSTLAQVKARLDEVESELKVRTDIMNETSIVSEADKKGDILSINEKFIEVSKYSRSELIGQPHNTTRHPDMPKDVFKQMWATIGRGQMFRGIIKNRAKDGTPYYVDAVIAPILGENGKPMKYLGVRYDITASEIERQNARGIVEAIDSSSAFVEFKPDGTMTSANGNFLGVMGFSADEVIGGHHRMFVDPVDALAPAYAAVLGRPRRRQGAEQHLPAHRQDRAGSLDPGGLRAGQGRDGPGGQGRQDRHRGDRRGDGRTHAARGRRAGPDSSHGRHGRATCRSASRWRARAGPSASCAPASTSCWKPARSSSPTSAGSSARSPRAT
ncbi:MAG: PAS domain S-box protein [Piscinibacter sp.]|nr:PAS domain S-box protein [Piscinibacter sp.]